MTDKSTEKLSSLEEIIENLGVCKDKDTVHCWIAKRQMPASKIGRLRKFKISEIDVGFNNSRAAEE